MSFYWRSMGNGEQRVCRPCEVEAGDPAMADDFHIAPVQLDGVVIAEIRQCTRCGDTETARLEVER